MRLPAYMTMRTTFDNDSGQLMAHITVKKWGMPILIFKALKDNFDTKWYTWLFYPYLCVKIMIGGDDKWQKEERNSN